METKEVKTKEVKTKEVKTLEKMLADAQWNFDYHTRKLNEYAEILKVLKTI